MNMNGVPESVLVKGGRVVDPANGRDGVMDVFLKDGKIARVGAVDAKEADRVLDARGLVVSPGLVDMHVHLREPGKEGAETVESGTAAAAAGGVTSVAAMPNTTPAMDNPSNVQFLLRRAAEVGVVRVWPIGAVTVGREGKQLCEIGALVRAGCVAVSDDGDPVADSRLFRRALEYAKLFDIPLIEHSEDGCLKADGVMNEGALSTKLGYAGMPRAAESVAVARNIMLAELTGGRLHLAHISTRESVALVRAAKAKGLHVTAEACPHHFILTEDAVIEHGTLAKMNPPLRSEKDKAALLEGLADGTIDVIATDHAPHTRATKEQEFSEAPFGITGLETLLPLVVTKLIEPGVLTWPQAIEKMSWAPSRLLKLPVGRLSEGSFADVTVIDPKEERTVSAFRSRSSNSPFKGWTLRGFARAVFVGGRLVHGSI